MAFSGKRVVSLQLYALGGKPPGPFNRTQPAHITALFLLPAVTRATFQVTAQRQAVFMLWAIKHATFQADSGRTGTFTLTAQRKEIFELEV
jgi:hypothetical protein